METQRLLRRVRLLLVTFVLGLLVSGITAFPLQSEIGILKRVLVDDASIANLVPGLSDWIARVYAAITQTYTKYPFMAYGTDWLGFAHIVIAVAFWGPIRDPLRNIWVVEFGMIACVLVVPLAILFGPLRGIPFAWQLIDCSFGVVGIIPLWLSRNAIRQVMRMDTAHAPILPSAF